MRNNKRIFKRMQELNEYNSKIDMHMHTNWTDGKNSLLQMIAQANENKMNMIAITEHIRKESDYFVDYVSEINEVKSKYSMKIYSGFEAKILDIYGNIDILQNAVDMADIIIASVHRIPHMGKLQLPKEIPFGKLAEQELKLSLSAIRNSKIVNVIGHSGGMSISTYGKFPEEYFENIIYECAENDIAFEFNYKYHQAFESTLKQMLLKYNPYVSVGSDAHEVNKISDRSFCNNEV